jgi:hypothetical protein
MIQKIGHLHFNEIVSIYVSKIEIYSLFRFTVFADFCIELTIEKSVVL